MCISTVVLVLSYMYTLAFVYFDYLCYSCKYCTLVLSEFVVHLDLCTTLFVLIVVVDTRLLVTYLG